MYSCVESVHYIFLIYVGTDKRRITELHRVEGGVNGAFVSI